MSEQWLGSRAALKNGNTNTFDTFYLGTAHTISLSGSSQQTSAFDSKTSLVTVFSTEDCFIQIGENPTASTSTNFIPGDIQFVFATYGGWKIAAIQGSGGGTLYISEGA